MTFSLIIFAAFSAGFIDAIVGGGGLILIPGLLILYPTVPIPTLFGTNKLASMAGTTSAVFRYAKEVKINWGTLLPGAGAAFIAAYFGARAADQINPEILKPMVVAILIMVAIYTFVKKDLGSLHAPKLSIAREFCYGILAGGIIGFYDGLVGPGTGSFLVLVFIVIYGFNFIGASASAKIVNLATNGAAFIYFASSDNVIYEIGIPMALANVAGATLGAGLAVRKGSAFVRRIFLIVLLVLISKLVFDLIS